MAKISKDLSAGTLHPRESQFATGTLGNLGSEVTVAADGAASVSIDVRGTASLVLEVAGSVDGINWTVIPMRPFAWNSSSYFTYFSSAFVGVAAGKCGPFRWVRARVASYTSGSVNVCLLADTAPMDDRFEKITPLMATATGAASAAVSLTLPNPSSGLRHYLTYLSIDRFAATALTAATTPLTVTTTNLPGSLALTVGAGAAAQGTIDSRREDFAYPIASTSISTTTTIDCPATTGVIWRVTAGYFVAP